LRRVVPRGVYCYPFIAYDIASVWSLGSKFCWMWWFMYVCMYRGADKPLARPGRKQATATEDFDVHISDL